MNRAGKGDNYGLIETEGNDSMCGIIWGDTNLDAITFYYLDPVFFHSAGKNTSYNDLIIAFYFHRPATQYPGNDAFQLD
jgi:hypothetical protein